MQNPKSKYSALPQARKDAIAANVSRHRARLRALTPFQAEWQSKAAKLGIKSMSSPYTLGEQEEAHRILKELERLQAEADALALQVRRRLEAEGGNDPEKALALSLLMDTKERKYNFLF